MTAPQRRRIEIDRTSLLELARGANLYEHPLACIRELLQNAADATLIRLFETRGAAAFPTHEGSLIELRAALASMPVELTLTGEGEPPPKGFVRVRLRDRGTGIARSDLEFLGTVGASWRNPRRRSVVETMPEWMRPSGTFGIGLHSAFLVADELRLRTTHVETGDAFAVRMFREGDDVALEVSDAEPLDGGGTEVTLDVPREAMGRYAMLDAEEHDQRRRERDPLSAVVHDDALLRAGDLVRQIARATVVPVIVDGARIASAVPDTHVTFHPETGLELAWLDLGADVPAGATWTESGHDPYGRSTTYYRGALIGDDTHGALRVHLHVHFGTARSLLQLSRARMSHEGAKELRARFAAALLAVGPRWLDPAAPTVAPPHVCPWVSRALWWLESPHATDAWRDAAVARAESGPRITLGKIADEGQAVLIRSHGERYETFAEVGEPPRVCDVLGGLSAMHTDLGRLFDGARTEEVTELPPNRRFGHAGERITIRVGNGLGGATVVAFAAGLRFGSALDYSRNIVQCPDGHEPLIVDSDAVLLAWGEKPSPRRRRRHDAIVLPWVVVGDTIDAPLLDAWVRLIATHTPDGVPRDPADVARAAWRLIAQFDPDVRARRGKRVLYTLDSIRAELEQAFSITLASH